MSDTREQIQALLKGYVLDEYYERQDGVVWCLAEKDQLHHIIRIEGHAVDPWINFIYEQDAQESFNNIVEEFSDQERPGRCQGEPPKNKSEELSTLAKINRSEFGKFGHTLMEEKTLTFALMEDEITGKTYPLFIEGEEVRDTLENCVTQASVSELIDTIVHLLDKTDLLECRFNSDSDIFHDFRELDRTTSIIKVYDLYIKSSKKRECLELVASPFFQAMIDDYEDSAARESLDYLLSLLVK